MNRIQPYALESSVVAPSPPETAQALSRVLRGPTVRLATFAPLHYEANYPYPLLVWLHGGQGSEQQLQRVMPHLSLRNYVGVAPRGARAPDSRGNGFDWPQTAPGVDWAEQAIFEAIDRAGEQFHVHPARVFLAGYDAGGAMALRIGLRHADRFAGVLSLCGGLPTGAQLFAQWDRLRRLPLFLAHGRYGTEYSEQTACHDLRLLHGAGMSVTLRQYPCRDDVTGDMLSDMNTWMMEIVTGSQARS